MPVGVLSEVPSWSTRQTTQLEYLLGQPAKVPVRLPSWSSRWSTQLEYVGDYSSGVADYPAGKHIIRPEYSIGCTGGLSCNCDPVRVLDGAFGNGYPQRIFEKELNERSYRENTKQTGTNEKLFH